MTLPGLPPWTQSSDGPSTPPAQETVRETVNGGTQNRAAPTSPPPASGSSERAGARKRHAQHPYKRPAQHPGTAAKSDGAPGAAKRHKSRPEEASGACHHAVRLAGAVSNSNAIVASNRALHHQRASTTAGTSGASGTARRHRSEPDEASGVRQHVAVMPSTLGEAPANSPAARRSSVAAAEYKDQVFLQIGETHAQLLAKLARGEDLAEEQLKTRCEARYQRHIVNSLAQRGIERTDGDQLVADVVRDLLRPGHQMDGYVLRLCGDTGEDCYIGRVHDDHIVGAGLYYFGDGEFTIGMWKDSELDGHAKNVKPDGTVIEGPHVKGQEHGIMTVTGPDGSARQVNYDRGCALSTRQPTTSCASTRGACRRSASAAAPRKRSVLAGA